MKNKGEAATGGLVLLAVLLTFMFNNAHTLCPPAQIVYHCTLFNAWISW